MTKYEVLEEKREEKRRERMEEYFNAELLKRLAEPREASLARFRREIVLVGAKYLTIV